jgi:hypothetical protein
MAVSYQKHELLSLSKHLGSPRVFGEFRVAHLFSFLCYVYGLSVFILCIVPNVTSVPVFPILGCTFGSLTLI